MITLPEYAPDDHAKAVVLAEYHALRRDGFSPLTAMRLVRIGCSSDVVRAMAESGTAPARFVRQAVAALDYGHELNARVVRGGYWTRAVRSWL